MDYHLENVRTGQTYSLNPNRTLIGLAEHADVPTSDEGSYLAALIVRYPSGWIVHGLSDNPLARYNGEPLGVGRQISPRYGDLIEVGEDQFRFRSPRGPSSSVVKDDSAPPSCFVYVRGQDGQEECRAVDHDVLFGRLNVCHVRFHDTRLSRIGALLASHDGRWHIHALSKGPIGRNRRAVTGFTPVADGDELQIGPLVVRVELRSAAEEPQAEEPQHFDADSEDSAADTIKDESAVTDMGSTVEVDPALDEGPRVDIEAIKTAGLRLDNWLKNQTAPATTPVTGLSSWLGAQRQKLNRFWYDTPEATAARGLRAAERYDEAFTLLDRAIRNNPNSPELLRELYRLYDAIGLHELCYRPLRAVEKLAADRGSTDPWVLETLARLCEKLSPIRGGMFDRAMTYWTRLEKATGVSYAKERHEARATRALREAGFTKAAE
jgi:hypothetical protein